MSRDPSVMPEAAQAARKTPYTAAASPSQGNSLAVIGIFDLLLIAIHRMYQIMECINGSKIPILIPVVVFAADARILI